MCWLARSIAPQIFALARLSPLVKIGFIVPPEGRLGEEQRPQQFGRSLQQAPAKQVLDGPLRLIQRRISQVIGQPHIRHPQQVDMDQLLPDCFIKPETDAQPDWQMPFQRPQVRNQPGCQLVSFTQRSAAKIRGNIDQPLLGAFNRQDGKNRIGLHRQETPNR